MGEGDGAVRVLIVDDHVMVADGLAAVLGGDGRFEVIGVAGTGAEAVEFAETSAFDVAVVDYRLPDLDGGEVAVELKKRLKDLAVVLVTAADGFGVVSRAMAAGAEGFVHKSSPIAEIAEAVAAVAAGDAWFRPETLASLSKSLSAPRSGLGVDLTEREMEVLSLLANGASTDGMVEGLVLSPHTVRNHVRNVMMKLGAHSKLEAVTIALRGGIVQIGGEDD